MEESNALLMLIFLSPSSTLQLVCVNRLHRAKIDSEKCKYGGHTVYNMRKGGIEQMKTTAKKLITLALPVLYPYTFVADHDPFLLSVSFYSLLKTIYHSITYARQINMFFF
jgi:hypothetical protein